MSSISHANAVPDGDDLVVTWRGGSPETTVFVSDDAEDAGVDVRSPDSPGRSVIARGDKRLYVHLFEPEQGFTVVAERRLELDGPDNFRDLGGYPTRDGNATRWGRVFRSDRLDGLSDADHAVLRQLGIGIVFDLRSDEEIADAPDRLPEGIAYVHLPMSSDVAQKRSIVRRIADDELRKYDSDDMAAGYMRMLEGFGDHLSVIIEAVAEGEPVLFHCTAGKDRTGVTAMVLLGLAGVDDSHLLDDYELTNLFRPEYHDGQTARGNPFEQLLRGKGLDPVDFETLFLAPREVMRQTVEGLHARWGDHADYVSAIGVTDQTIAAARTALRHAG